MKSMSSLPLLFIFLVFTQARVIINEFDYGDADFVELFNQDDNSSYDLSSFELDILDDMQPTYRLLLPSYVIPPKGYFVVCGNAQKIAKYSTMCNWDLALSTPFVSQNSPSAVVLFNTVVVDTVSYRGATTGYTEGNPVGSDDNGILFDVGTYFGVI